MSAAPEVLLPSSADEAVSLFGDGADVTVVGGGTIVMPELTYGRAEADEGAAARTGRARRDLARRLDASRSARRHRSHELAGEPAPLGAVRGERRRPRDPLAGDRRRQPLRRRGPRGAARRPPGRAARARRDRPLGRRRRRSRASRSRTSCRSGRAGSCSTSPSRSRPPARSPRSTGRTPTTTRRSPSRRSAPPTARSASPRPAPAGWAPRLPSAEAAAADPEAAGKAALERRHAPRRRARLGLVPRAHAAGARPPCPRRTRGVRMNLTVNGIEHEVESAPLTTAPRRAARRARGRRARRPAASRAAAARAPSSSTASRGARASRRSRPSTARRSRPSRGSARRTTSRRCSRRSCTTTPRSAASAPPG